MAPSHKLKFLQGSASNLLRILLSMVVSLLLPRFLVHRMSLVEYNAWFLVLQLSAYVNYLDFGVQTAISKFVAEYDAVGDRESARNMLSTAFSFLSLASLAGLLVIALLTYRIPQMFHQMPSSLFHEVRIGLLCVGISVCAMLPLSVFGTAFTGLQEYGYLTLVQVSSRLLSALALVVIILARGTLVQMAWALALFNLATGLSQVWGWKRYASTRVPFSLFHLDRRSLRTLAEYCGILSIWTMGSLLISGLDTAIVAHFDFINTGYYGFAGSATNFMLMLSSNAISPLLPAISSLQNERTPEQMGWLLLRSTRIGVLVLLSLGLPLLLGGYPLLTLWLGGAIAAKTVLFLEILVAGNILRQLGLPYAIFIIAMGKQRYATLSPVVESLLNLVLSVILARRYGAIGVALGTLIAASVGLAAHLLVSMHYTQSSIAVSRLRFVTQGVLRPCVALLPSVAVLPFWHRMSLSPASPSILVLWLLTTFALVLRFGLDRTERVQLRSRLSGLGRLLY